MFSIAALILASRTAAQTIQTSGFVLVRGSSQNSAGPFFDDDPISAQAQIGIDWRPSMTFGAHVHLLARDDSDDSRRGMLGIPEAYIEANFHPGGDRVRILAGAFFLPTSRENIDALWENPYTVTSSALNSWFGEEFRPVGVDVSYTMRRSLLVGATIFTGNDTFGALPAERGWSLSDRWTVLGEHVRVDEEYFTSISAETDNRIGWSGRLRWNSDHSVVQFTHIDNRSDARQHGDLLNWDTQFNIAGFDYSLRNWTLAGESGWGKTAVITDFGGFTSDIAASYLLLSRRFSEARASVRGDWYRTDDKDWYATTAAVFWSPRGPWRIGLEVSSEDDDQRALVDLRYSFATSY